MITAAATNFEQVPRDKTSIQGSTAQFLCVISDQDNCPLLVWRFTGNNEGRIIRTVGHSSTVTLDASVANNGTMIECGCRYSSSNLDYTTPVQLLVQGIGLLTTIRMIWHTGNYFSYVLDTYSFLRLTGSPFKLAKYLNCNHYFTFVGCSIYA